MIFIVSLLCSAIVLRCKYRAMFCINQINHREFNGKKYTYIYMTDYKTIKERLTYFIKSKKIGQGRFEALCGLSNGYVNNIRVSIQPDKLQKIALQFPDLNPGWLMTGEGEMLRSSTSQLLAKSNHSESLPSNADRVDTTKLIPLYELSETDGTDRRFITERQSPIDYIYIPNVTSCDGAVFIRGNSMSPYLGAGDIALFKQVKNIPGGIYWGEIYLISFNLEGNHYTAVQYLKQSDQKDCVTLANYDRQQKTQDIPMSSIQALAIIKAGIKYTSML